MAGATAAMHGGGGREAGLAGLARNIDRHAKLSAQPACGKQAGQAAKLDRFEAYSARGLALMVAADVIERVNALVGANRHRARCGDAAHAVKIMRTDGLLEKIEAAIAEATHESERGVDGKALIGVG